MIRVSDITSLLFCQRYCYFSLCERVRRPVEMDALRELYFSRRSGREDWKEWARRKFAELYCYDEENECDEVFSRAAELFRYSKEVERLESLEIDVPVRNEEIGLSGRLDEVVFDGEKRLLVLSSRAPKEGVWYSDRIRLAAFSIITSLRGGYVYYCRSGDLRGCEVRGKDRHTVLKCMERIEKLRNGFLPEKKEDMRKCESCIYREVCEDRGETFASRFL